MLPFLGKKEQQPKPKPTTKRIKLLKRILNCFELGQRVRYHLEFEKQQTLENLVIGFAVDDHKIFQKSDYSFKEDDKSIQLILNTPDKKLALNRIEKIHLILPGNMGEEKKLDHDSRSNLGRKGPFSRNNRLIVTSTNEGTENLSMSVDVDKHHRLREGVHAGHHVVLLEIDLKSIETYELRSSPRVHTNVPALLHKEGEDVVIPGTVLDISEYYMRLSLSPPQIPWPELKKRESMIITLRTFENKPPIKLKCVFARESGKDRVFRITEIERQSEFVTFQMIDAMQLKIELMNFTNEQSR